VGTREKEPGGWGGEGKTLFVGRIKRRPQGGVPVQSWVSVRVSEGLHRRGSRVASEAGEGIVPLHVAGGLLGLAWLLLPPHRGAGPLG
jgi:hypothetical protein